MIYVIKIDKKTRDTAMRLFKRLILLGLYSLFTIPLAHADITVGTVLFYPPFVMPGGSGFDIQFMQMICQRLQQNCQFKTMNFNELYTALNGNSIDIAIGGITIDSAPSTKFIYSLPYVLSKGTFLILKNNNAVQSLEQLVGKKVGIIKGNRDGGVFNNYLLTHFTDQFEIMQYDTMENLIAALTNGDIASAFTHESSANYWKLNGAGQFTTVGPALVVGQGIGIMSTPQNQLLIQQINQQIQQLEEESFYLNLYDTYFANER